MLNLLANQQAEVRSLAGLLRTDPALSAEVLAVANSSFYGTPQYIDNLARAILVLGFERTRSLTLTTDSACRGVNAMIKHRSITDFGRIEI